MAKGQVEARATWVEGLQFVFSAEEPHGTLVMDGSPEHGGSDNALRPMEVLLGALVGCTGMDVISILRKKRQKVTGLCLKVTGHRAEEHPRRYTQIEIEFVVRGVDVSPQTVERAIELSHTKYCGVTASLNCKVLTSYRVEEEPACT